MRERGFTLIELVCVMIILGSLAVIATPGFVDLADDAAHASVAQHARSFATATRLVAGIYALARRSGTVDNLPGYAGGIVDTNAVGYPTDTAGGNAIPNNATGANRCRNLFGALLSAPAAICGGSLACDDSYDFRASTAGPQTCRYEYLEDTTPARFFTYSAATGTVSVTNP